MPTVEDNLVQLSALTGMSVAAWADFLDCTEDQQRIILQNYADANWTKDKNVLLAVLEVLGVIGTVAGVVSGVAGAASAVVAVKGLL